MALIYILYIINYIKQNQTTKWHLQSYKKCRLTSQEATVVRSYTIDKYTCYDECCVIKSTIKKVAPGKRSTLDRDSRIAGLKQSSILYTDAFDWKQAVFIHFILMYDDVYQLNK